MGAAQDIDSLSARQSTIREARALKSIYKTDEAIESTRHMKKTLFLYNK